MGRERVFRAWDIGDDTFIFEKGISTHLGERPSVLVAEKRDLRHGKVGRVFTMTTGNHSVAAFPLLDGRFWKISRIPSARRGEVLMHAILCANVVNETIEISQRDVPSAKLYAADGWLLGSLGFAMNDIVMGDRNETTLAHYRELGQEWRVKPLAWTETEMKVALAGAKKRIATKLNYYHSARGVHFLTFPELRRFASLAQDDPAEFVRGVKELVSVYEGQPCSFCRMPKHRGHHEIELFGLRRGVAQERLIPALEQLMEAVALGRLGQLGVIQRAQEILSLYESLLTRPEFADETSPAFVETLYMYITGEIYSVAGEGSTPAFDDRRTALPGATYVGGRAVLHPGADARSEVLLSNLRGLMSKDEIVVYANVYEIRQAADVPIGKGKTREIVYKTNRSPLEKSLIEKRLSSARRGYGSYMLARIGALKALGLTLSANYMLLRRRPHKGRRPLDFYIRERCEGEPMDSIPANYFCNADDASVEEKDVVLGLATLMGDAAAQNMAMKKYDAAGKSCLYGIGKEIYAFGYDIKAGRMMPLSVSTCSVRGVFGWPDLSFSEENLGALARFYLGSYAATLREFASRHPVAEAKILGERFFAGFEHRTRAMEWACTVQRDQFEGFAPHLPPRYGFPAKWHFALWSLERQMRRIDALRKLFNELYMPSAAPVARAPAEQENEEIDDEIIILD